MHLPCSKCSGSLEKASQQLSDIQISPIQRICCKQRVRAQHERALSVGADMLLQHQDQ